MEAPAVRRQRSRAMVGPGLMSLQATVYSRYIVATIYSIGQMLLRGNQQSCVSTSLSVVVLWQNSSNKALVHP
jgi:hypothetical protein